MIENSSFSYFQSFLIAWALFVFFTSYYNYLLPSLIFLTISLLVLVLGFCRDQKSDDKIKRNQKITHANNDDKKNKLVCRDQKSDDKGGIKILRMQIMMIRRTNCKEHDHNNFSFQIEGLQSITNLKQGIDNFLI